MPNLVYSSNAAFTHRTASLNRAAAKNLCAQNHALRRTVVGSQLVQSENLSLKNAVVRFANLERTRPMVVTWLFATHTRVYPPATAWCSSQRPKPRLHRFTIFTAPSAPLSTPVMHY